ncbi:MAG: ATP synthase F0 subunit C [Desulfobacterales bacterium]
MSIDIDTWIQVAAFAGGGLAMGFGAIGAAIGEGFTASEASIAISRNPKIAGDIFKSMLVGQAIAESAAIFALVVAMILLFTDFSGQTMLTVSVLLAGGLSMGLGAIGAGIGSGLPGGEACTGMSRQPAMSGQLTTNMLIGSAVCQTPSIFALVISFILLFSDFSALPIAPTWAAILGTGLAVGLAAIGSGLGAGFVAQTSCEGMARQPTSATTVTNIMLLAQAVTQTPAIYGILIAFILLFKGFAPTASLPAAMALLAAGLCMGFGAIGPGIGIGNTGKSAVRWIARNKDSTADLTRTMLVGQAVCESTAIYSLVVALVLIFVI